MSSKLFFIVFITLSTLVGNEKKMYSKEYHDNGKIKSEGWVLNTKKTNYWRYYYPSGAVASEGHYKDNLPEAYWYFYAEDGKVIKEGHYKNGIAQDWWIFYDIAGNITHKTQYANHKKNGFSLVYLNNKLVKVEKYKDDAHTGQWTSISSFRRDNPDVSFRK